MAQPDQSDDRQDPLQGLPEIKTIAVNQGFIPESLLFWRRWRKPSSAAQGRSRRREEPPTSRRAAGD